MEKCKFIDIVSKTRPKLLAICGRFFGRQSSGMEAEDVVQETYMRMWKMQGNLHGYKSPEALAVVIAKNICIDILRRDAKGKRTAIADNSAVDERQTEQAVISKETEAMIAEGVAGLPETQRRAIMMRSEGMSMEEIAAACGITPASARIAICRGRKKLMEQLRARRGEK